MHTFETEHILKCALLLRCKYCEQISGPFWVCTTLVFMIAIAGNIANYIQTQGHDYQWAYDFHKGNIDYEKSRCQSQISDPLLYCVITVHNQILKNQQ